MKKTPQIIDMTPVKHEVVSAQEFVRIAVERPYAVARSRFVPPRIGSKGFGSFEVEYTTPILRTPAMA